MCDFLMDFREMVKIALKKQKMDPWAVFKPLYLSNIVHYTMTSYRKIWATKAQHSSHIFWLMFNFLTYFCWNSFGGQSYH
jgi:hypothetical protein